MSLKKKCLEFLEASDYYSLDSMMKEVQPDSYEIWNYWGIAKANLNDGHGANHCFSKAMEFKGIDVSVFLNYFTSSFPIGKGREVLPYLERLVPGLDEEHINNIVVPNLIEAMICGDLNLYEMPKSLYHYFLNGEEPLDYVMNHFNETRSFLNKVYLNIDDREKTINQALSMDEGRRLALIRYTAALAHIYQVNLADLNTQVLTPENSEFENVVYETSKMLHLMFNNYNIEGATREDMIQQVLPDDNFFIFLRMLGPLVAAQRFQLAPAYEASLAEEMPKDVEAECDLMLMLNFSHCKCLHDIHLHARKVAHELINNWKIQTLKGDHRFLALEFYLHIPGVMEDSAVHCRTEQLNKATFYLHTKSKAPNWSPPIFNRHGIDITCGSKEHNIHGGILIRHISGEDNQDGSGRALRVLMRGDEGFKSIKQGSPEARWTDQEKNFFAEFNNSPIFDGDIQLVYDPQEEQMIESTKRVGIEKTSHGEVHLRFLVKK